MNIRKIYQKCCLQAIKAHFEQNMCAVYVRSVQERKTEISTKVFGMTTRVFGRTPPKFLDIKMPPPKLILAVAVIPQRPVRGEGVVVRGSKIRF